MPGLQDLAIWRHLRGPRSEAALADPVVPAGSGPLILICGSSPELRGLVHGLRRGRPGLRLGGLGPVPVDGDERPVPEVLAQPPADLSGARALVARAEPDAVLLVGGTLPAALIAACDQAGVPVTLYADRMELTAAAARSAWRGAQRDPVSRVSRVWISLSRTR